MDMTESLPKLKGEQCDILYLPRHSNQVILGVAGSGKSIEAICRATWIGMTDPDSGDKVIVLSFNKDVNDEIRQKLSAAVSGHKNNIKVLTIYSYCKYLINKYSPKKDSMLYKLKTPGWKLYSISAKNDEKALKAAINVVNKDEPSASLWNKDKYPDFIHSEIEWMQNNKIPYDDEQTYLSAHRIGRNNENISQNQRNTMYKIYHEYYEIRLHKYGKLFNFMDIYRFIPQLDIPDNDKPKYIVIDEVQDITPNMFRALKYVLSPRGYWNVFGDLAQNIFGQKISWRKALGININKIYRLKINYRNSYEIGLFSKSILDHIKLFQQKLNNSISNMDDPLLSQRHGNKPKIEQISNLPIKKLCSYVNEVQQIGSTAIICMDRSDVIKIIDILHNDGIDYCTSLKSYNKYHGIFVQSINQIKGMEFNNVIIYGIDSSDNLKDRPEIINSDNTLNVNIMNIEDKLTVAERVYVSATRARDNLLLLYKNNPLTFLFEK